MKKDNGEKERKKKQLWKENQCTAGRSYSLWIKVYTIFVWKEPRKYEVNCKQQYLCLRFNWRSKCQTLHTSVHKDWGNGLAWHLAIDLGSFLLCYLPVISTGLGIKASIVYVIRKDSVFFFPCFFLFFSSSLLFIGTGMLEVQYLNKWIIMIVH